MLERWDDDPPYEQVGDLQERLDAVPEHQRGKWWRDAYGLRWLSDLSDEQRRLLRDAEGLHPFTVTETP